MPRSYFGALSALGRHEAIAVLDGASLKLQLHPNVASAAVARARTILGDSHYGDLQRQGAAMTIDEVEALLLAEAADL